jgi:hypothetical protein
LLVPWTTVVLAFAGAAALSAVLFAMALRNPRLMLQDYPKDMQAAVPPKTAAERRETVGWGVLFLVLLFGTPLAAAVTARLQQPGLSFGGGFLNVFLVLLVFNLVDWLLLDWLVFCTLTPRFVILPGTEGMAGYKDYAIHFRGFLIGLGLSLVASALSGLVVILLPL